LYDILWVEMMDNLEGEVFASNKEEIPFLIIFPRPHTSS
jgi:hypothetical protein